MFVRIRIDRESLYVPDGEKEKHLGFILEEFIYRWSVAIKCRRKRLSVWNRFNVIFRVGKYDEIKIFQPCIFLPRVSGKTSVDVSVLYFTSYYNQKKLIKEAFFFCIIFSFFNFFSNYEGARGEKNGWGIVGGAKLDNSPLVLINGEDPFQIYYSLLNWECREFYEESKKWWDEERMIIVKVLLCILITDKCLCTFD